MTIICALNDPAEGCVWIGGNDRCTFGNLISPSPDNKWLPIGNWLLGFSGSGPKFELIANKRAEFEKIEGNEIEFLATFRTLLSDAGLGENDEGVQRYAGSGILIHRTGRIWDMDSTLALTSILPDTLWMRGSGMEIAMGASKALKPYNLSGHEHLSRVIEIVVDTDIDSPGQAQIQCFDRDGTLTEIG